jgi:type IV pilus assembly protein PilM
MASPYAWGIDIGNRALKAVRLSQGPEGLFIEDFDVVEHEQILSNAGDNKEGLLISALANFVQRHELKKAPVAIGVSGQNSFARFIKLPPVEPRKIPEIVRFEAIQQIPFPLDEVEWSYQLFQDEKSPDVEVGIFAMRRDLVNQQIKYFTDMGLNVQVVQMNPLAVYNAMYYDERIKGTTMMIDVGAETTDLIIAEGENVWLRSLPVGGNKFTEALVTAYKLKFPKAEEMKRNTATSKYGRQILQAMKPVFNELVSEIQRSIGFYASTHRDSRITRVLALGGTFRLPGLQKYVQQNLQIEVHRIDRLSNAAPAEARTATIFNENILSSVSAYGLALQAMDQAKIKSSLLPIKIRKEKMWREKIPWFGLAAAVFVAAVGVGWGSIYYANHALEANHQLDLQNNQVLKTASTLDTSWESSVESAGQPDRVRANNYQSLKQGRDIQNTLIGDILACLPPVDPKLLTADKTKLPPRDQRDIIRIDQFSMEYRDDMSPITAMSNEGFRTLTVQRLTAPSNAGATAGGGVTAFRPGNMGGQTFNRPGQRFGPGPGGHGEVNAEANAPKQRGFIIELVCTTPKAGGASYVLDHLVNKLHLQRKDGDVKYKVDKVEEPFSVRLGSEAPAAPGAAPPSAYTPAGRLGQPGAPVDPNAAVDAFDPMKDPVTGEDMSSDTRVTIRMSVLLDPLPEAAANGAVAAQQ